MSVIIVKHNSKNVNIKILLHFYGFNSKHVQAASFVQFLVLLLLNTQNVFISFSDHTIFHNLRDFEIPITGDSTT